MQQNCLNSIAKISIKRAREQKNIIWPHHLNICTRKVVEDALCNYSTGSAKCNHLRPPSPTSLNSSGKSRSLCESIPADSAVGVCPAARTACRDGCGVNSGMEQLMQRVTPVAGWMISENAKMDHMQLRNHQQERQRPLSAPTAQANIPLSLRLPDIRS
ncbi:hypothetical protein PR048_011942 [Dryococelus australis]|uniref:Uncharacterized protein n=1 Tax=Dryococelus australis TaxID=614101 RepID=A0ABQ9HNC1_9NEOP|nr:hypothetical protein PR048_011942 [Dryococelus australis]